MHALFAPEDNYGLKGREIDGEVCLTVDMRKNKDAAQLHEMLCSWQEQAAKLEKSPKRTMTSGDTVIQS